MDQDSCHCVCCTCGHHTGTYPGSCPFSSVSYGTPPWSSDPAGALVAGVSICTVPAGAFAATLHHAAVLHIQLHLQNCQFVSYYQEEEMTSNQASAIYFPLILGDHFPNF